MPLISFLQKTTDTRIRLNILLLYCYEVAELILVMFIQVSHFHFVNLEYCQHRHRNATLGNSDML